MQEAPEKDSQADAYLERLSEQVQEVLDPHYRPADGPGDATSMFTTAEVHFTIEEHAPGLISLGEMREVLKRLDYREHQVGDDLRWLLKRA